MVQIFNTSIEPTRRTRNDMVQFFRALAIIAVVMIHTTPMGYCQVYCRPFINFAVATFLFLSGFLTKKDNHNWGHFYKKRILRVIIPYVIWTGLYTLALRNFDKFLPNLLTANITFHMYFIFVYIQFVILTPILGKLATSKYQFIGWLVAPISVIVFKYYWLLSGQQLNPQVALIWNDSCLGWFTFYYLGLILGNNILEKKYSLRLLAFLYIASIIIQMAEGYVWLSLGEENCGTQIKLSSLLTSSLFLLMVYTILKNNVLFETKNKLLRMIGDYSFGIYLCHIMVKSLLNHYLPIYQSIPYPINSFIVVLLSLLCCYIGNIICGERVSKWIGLK